MNERRFDRIAEAYLADGPTVLADRVLDAALDEVHLTRQRRSPWHAPWRFPDMNTFAKLAVAAVAVIAVGLLGLNLLGPDRTGVGEPSAAPSASPAPTSSPTATPSAEVGALPLTGEFTSERHGYTISYPEGWSTRPATTPWTSGVVDYFNDGADLLQPGDPGTPFVALASQPLGDKTRAEWEADVWQMLIDDDAATAECRSNAVPITIDGAEGVKGCDAVLVTDGGRGYVVMLWISSETTGFAAEIDRALYESILATMQLQPEDAVYAAASSTAPTLSGQFTSERHGYTISYPEGWSPRPATAPWTSGVVDFFNEGSDLLAPGDPGNPFLALASQPLGDRTRAEWEADVWQILVDDDPGTAVCASTAEPITIDGAPGLSACNTALVTDGGRGYVVMLWSSTDDAATAGLYDDAWFSSVLATMQLQPEDAVDAGA